MSELTKRVLVAAIGIPLAFFVMYIGGDYFSILITIICSATLWEFYNLFENDKFKTNKISAIVLSVIYLGIFYLYISLDSLIGIGLASFLFICLVPFVLFTIRIFQKTPYPTTGVAISTLGIIYITLGFASMIAIRNFDNVYDAFTISKTIMNGINIDFITQSDNRLWSFYLLVSLFVSIWTCDSMAYFSGKAFGKNKLAPRHSPNKTIEGAIGGLIGGIIGFSLPLFFFVPYFPMLHAVIIGILIGIFGQIGDLVQSQTKREFNQKDSGTFFPGHGGFYDRFDSVIFVSPVVFVYLVIMTNW